MVIILLRLLILLQKNLLKDMLDNNAEHTYYAFIPKVNLKKVVVPTKTLLDIFNNIILMRKIR